MLERERHRALRPSAPLRARARRRVTSAMRTTQSAIAVPTFSAPGRPRKRKIATGTRRPVGLRDEDRRAELADGDRERERRRDGERARQQRQLDLASHPARGRAEHRGGVGQARVTGAERGGERADDERRRDERLGERHDRDGRAEVERRVGEGEQEAEPQHHRGGAERQHQQRVERRAPRRATANAAGTPTASAISGGRRREEERVDDGMPRRHEQRRRLVEQRREVVEAVAVPDAERAQHEARAAGSRSEARPSVSDDPVDREPAAAGRPRGRPRRDVAAPPRRRSSIPETITTAATRGELEEGERRGRAQVEEARRLVVDLRLERASSGSRRGRRSRRTR